MLRTRVIPCLLLKNKGLVKTKRFKEPVYLGDPINTVKLFNEKEVDELIFLDIEATNQNREPHFDYIKEIASECFMPFAYGGGIKTLEDIKKIFYLGAEKVILNTAAIQNHALIKDAVKVFGGQSIVISIDYKTSIFGKKQVYARAGRKNTYKSPIVFAKQMAELGVGEIFINAINNDGMMQGYDLKTIAEISSEISIPIIACGGAGKLEDLKEAVDAGASAASAGSLFVFQGVHNAVLINYPTQGELESILKES